MSLLKKLTLIIPTFGRPRFIVRAMNYWSDKDVQLIVLDGSPESLTADFVKGLTSNIRYVHNPVSIQQRLADATSMLSTEYVAFFSDDDLFAESGLAEAIAELDLNPELACCNGICVSFNWHSIDAAVTTRLHYPEQIHFNLTQPAVELRVGQHFRNYTPASIYAVHRKSSFILAMRAAAHANSCIYSAEIAFEFVTAYLGGMKTLNVCYWLRSMENQPVQTAGSNRALRFHQWLVDSEYQQEVKDWYQYVSNTLTSSTAEQSRVVQLLQTACKNYLLFVEEYFAQTHRGDRGAPAVWNETQSFLESKGVRTLPEMKSMVQLIKDFHLSHLQSNNSPNG